MKMQNVQTFLFVLHLTLDVEENHLAPLLQREYQMCDCILRANCSVYSIIVKIHECVLYNIARQILFYIHLMLRM